MIPLCVDLDGTLIHNDLLLDSLLHCAKKQPLSFISFAPLLLKSKAKLKSKLSHLYSVDANSLPYNESILEWLKLESTKRDIVLITGSHEKYARDIFHHLGIFKSFHGTTDHINLTGENKAKFLIEKFGEKKFDYVGNSSSDIPVWQAANKGFSVVESTWGLPNVEIKADVLRKKQKIKMFFKLLRPHQWSKNLLVFLPLILAQNFQSTAHIILALQIFFSFCFMASAVYILNDIMDIESDRRHPIKKKRPIASGRISLKNACIVFISLVTMSIFTSYRIDYANLILFPLCYLGLNILYSIYLKSLLIVDVFILTLFYLIRIQAGGLATNDGITYWLLSFSFFIFFSLALVKRYTELLLLYKVQGRKTSSGRAYGLEDVPVLLSIGISSGIASTVVLGMFFHFGINSELYSSPKFLWGVEALVLVWLCNIWVRAARGKVNDDPVQFALTDKFSIIICILSASLVFLAI